MKKPKVKNSQKLQHIYPKPISKWSLKVLFNFHIFFSLDETETKEVNTLNISGKLCIFFCRYPFGTPFAMQTKMTELNAPMIY